jgi:predicted acetyltransferase
MSVEIRPATQDEMHDFARVSSTGLGIAVDRIGLEHPEQTLCAFENGNIVSTYRAIPFTVYCSGGDVEAAGIADVGTLPTHRRRGYSRHIITHHFTEMYERGEQPVAILWPSRGGIYRRYGYEFVTMQIKYRITPADIRFFDEPERAGFFRELKRQDTHIFAGLYHPFAEERIGYLHRGGEFWQKHLAKRREDSLETGALYVEDDEPAGYVLYDVEPLRGGRFHHQHQVTVKEIVYLRLSGFYAIWRYLAGLDLTSSIVLPSVSGDDPLPYLLAEPRALVRMETESSTTALMGRVVDIARALPKRG